ncbi:N-acetylmuramoyl-L-alanine amidase [Kocuria rhizophila]|nr:N-acetylmuramoyl-L-alanine amidase [Kocuria rhizophila]
MPASATHRRSTASPRRVRSTGPGAQGKAARAGAQDAELAPDTARDPSVFDGGVDRGVRGSSSARPRIVDGVVGRRRGGARRCAVLPGRPAAVPAGGAAPLHGDNVEKLQTNLSLLGFSTTDAWTGRSRARPVRGQGAGERPRDRGRRRGGPGDAPRDWPREQKKIAAAKAFSLRDHRRLESLHEALRGAGGRSGPFRRGLRHGARCRAPVHHGPGEITMDVAVRASTCCATWGPCPCWSVPPPAGAPRQEEPKRPRAEHDPAVTPVGPGVRERLPSRDRTQGEPQAGGRVSVRTRQEGPGSASPGRGAVPAVRLEPLPTCSGRRPRSTGATPPPDSPRAHRPQGLGHDPPGTRGRTGASTWRRHARQWSACAAQGQPPASG